MKLANVDGRAVVVTGDNSGFDVENASDGRFGPGLPEVYADWSAFVEWASSASGDSVEFSRDQLGAPSPAPRQIVAIGLNYDDHAKESNFEAPKGLPPTFTKFVSSLTGPDTTVTIPPEGKVDWEIELVVVIGSQAQHVSEDQAWDHVAGLTAGQDISERVSQLAGPAPQFSLGKSFPGFAPTGPWLVTVDEVDDRDDIGLGCKVNDEQMQSGSTKDLIFSVPRLISALSRTITLYPGDIIFTGTPAGVGGGRNPQVFLQDGDRLDSWVDGIGELHQTFVSAPSN